MRPSAIGRLKLDVHYAPGEHDILDGATAKAYHGAFWQGRARKRLLFLRSSGRAFHLDQQCRRSEEKRPWLSRRRTNWPGSRTISREKTASTPMVVFCHIPLWTIAPEWGWGTEDPAQVLALLARFGSVTVLNGHIHQVMQKVEGAVTFHTARSTAFPQPAPGTAPGARPPARAAGPVAQPARGDRCRLFRRRRKARGHRSGAGVVRSALSAALAVLLRRRSAPPGTSSAAKSSMRGARTAIPWKRTTSARAIAAFSGARRGRWPITPIRTR